MSSSPAQNRGTKVAVLAVVAVIAALMLLGWGTFFVLVLPGNFSIGKNSVFGFGLAITAFVLGVRHALDADHIAAIDNTTRKLIEDGQRPVTVGFWFALGHSTVVVVTVALLTAGLSILTNQVSDDSSALVVITGNWGILISGVFLLLIGLLTLSSLSGIWKVLRKMKTGTYEETQLETHLQKRGLLNRVLGPVARQVDKPWKMYVVGLLFSLGFDTATTIALLVIGGSAALLSAPWYVAMCLPLLFTAGMTLFDTLDGVMMNRVYQWAYERPVRKVYYNLTVTTISIAVAFLVGGLGLLGLLTDGIHATSGPLAWIASADLENFGFVISGLFLVTWLAAYAYWKLRRVEERYTPSSRVARPKPDDHQRSRKRLQ